MRIRKAQKKDKHDILVLSRQIWDDDYIYRVFDSWLEDGGFYVGELNGKVIGTAKLTVLPGDIAWLEGLRLMPNQQQMGLGRQLSEFVFKKALALKHSGKIEHIEFSTYYHNNASLHMGYKSGFNVIEKYNVLSIKNRGKKLKLPQTRLNKNDFSWKKRHISAGWKFLLKSDDAVEWLNNECNVYQADGFKIYVKHNDSCANINRFTVRDISYLKQCILSVTHEPYAELMIPSRFTGLAEGLIKNGFSYWDKSHEPNVYLLRYRENR